MKRIIPIILLSSFFIISITHGQTVAHHPKKNNADNAGWIKSKIEKYGGNLRKEISYKVEFEEKTGKIIISETSAGSNTPRFKYTMNICDFKEVRRNGMDLEILANGTSILGTSSSSPNQESVWAGIRINHFVQAESNIVNRLHNAFKSLSESSSGNCN
jgi:hypothetical protein